VALAGLGSNEAHMTVPTREEINPFDDLDGRVACENFLGKSLDEALELFRENPLEYQSDLLWMGIVAFKFYLPAAIQFIKQETSGEHSDFVAHFSGTLESKLENESKELVSVANQLVDVCDYIIQNWQRFEEGAEAYGDVLARYNTLRQSFLQMSDQRASTQ
jgi:hypothetical protein